MAESISFQNGNGVYSEDNANHDIQFKLNEDGSVLSLNVNVKFRKITPNLKVNETLLGENDFALGEVEVKLDKPIGKESILVYTTSTDNGTFLNIKIACNNNTTKKYMFGAGEEKKWMFGG